MINDESTYGVLALETGYIQFLGGFFCFILYGYSVAFGVICFHTPSSMDGVGRVLCIYLRGSCNRTTTGSVL